MLRLVNFSQTSPNKLECCQKQCKNNVNVVAAKLPCQMIVYTCLTIDIWTRRRRRTSMRLYALRCHPPKIGELLVKLASNVFDFTIDTPSSPEST
jgi:hypothetical protein